MFTSSGWLEYEFAHENPAGLRCTEDGHLVTQASNRQLVLCVSAKCPSSANTCHSHHSCEWQVHNESRHSGVTGIDRRRPGSGHSQNAQRHHLAEVGALGAVRPILLLVNHQGRPKCGIKCV